MFHPAKDGLVPPKIALSLPASVLLAFWLIGSPAAATDDHLLLCEAALTPSAAEFLEVVNPTDSAVLLDAYYLSDDEDYALLSGSSGAGPPPSIAAADFIVRFPAGTTLLPDGVVVVAMDGAGFEATFGFRATFEILGTDPDTPDMLAVDVGSTASLTNSGESAALFYWDGGSDLVRDVDLVNLGMPSSGNDIGDKTDLSVDGPDPGSSPSAYAPDGSTMPVQNATPGSGRTTKRVSLEGPHEVGGNGNGITGDDETTENILETWDSRFTFVAPDPGYCCLTPDCYYQPVDASTPFLLRRTLENLIRDHERFGYDSVWSILEMADRDPDDLDRILDVYKNASYEAVGDGSGPYQREHSWPKSYGFPDESDIAHSDCHALFLADGQYNLARSNNPYRTCSAPPCEALPTELNHGQGGPGHPNWKLGQGPDGVWETWDGRRGDVARALFYMDVRYAGDVHAGTGQDEPDLILVDVDEEDRIAVTGSNPEEGFMGILSTLLDWHREDPVNAVERARNESVSRFQRNRNPFIDHPEWAECVFSGNCGACAPGETTMCLADGRFRAELEWSSGGDPSPGRVVPFGSDDSGLFFFFNPDNWEMLVKVLDACSFNGRYWVFYAATTNVEFTLTVTDTASGASQVYSNTLGTPAPPVQDTMAFATCP